MWGHRLWLCKVQLSCRVRRFFYRYVEIEQQTLFENYFRIFRILPIFQCTIFNTHFQRNRTSWRLWETASVILDTWFMTWRTATTPVTTLKLLPRTPKWRMTQLRHATEEETGNVERMERIRDWPFWFAKISDCPHPLNGSCQRRRRSECFLIFQA